MNRFKELYPNATLEVTGEYHPFYQKGNMVEIELEDDFAYNCYDQNPNDAIPTMASVDIKVAATYYGTDCIYLNETDGVYKLTYDNKYNDSEPEEYELVIMSEMQKILDSEHIVSVEVEQKAGITTLNLIKARVAILKGEYLTPGCNSKTRYDTFENVNGLADELVNVLDVCVDVLESGVDNRANVGVAEEIDASKSIINSDIMVWFLRNLKDIAEQYSGNTLYALGVYPYGELGELESKCGFTHKRSETNYRFKI